LRAKEDEAKGPLQQIADKDRQLESLKISMENERRQFEEQLNALESERRRERRWLKAENLQLRQQLAVTERLEEVIVSKNRKIAGLRRRLEEVIVSKNRKIAGLRRKAKQGSQDRKTLVRWLQELDHETSVLLGSRWWKIGQVVRELRRKVMRRPPAQDRSIMALSQFRDWNEGRKRGRVGTEVGQDQPSERQSDGPANGPPRPATSDESSPSTPTVGLAETNGPEERWRFRHRRPQVPRTRPKVSVIAWDMTHNCVGRAYFIAGALSRKFDVEIIGARFPQYGTEIWGPVKDESIPTVDFVGQNFPPHFVEMEALAKHIDGDFVFVSKPRLASYELGILAKQFKNRPLILDVDDPELAFYNEADEAEGLTLDEVEALQQSREEEFLNPYSRLWAQYCESIIPYADHLTVSNAELQKKYGGTIFPHVKDERKFDPALYDRDSIRAKFGFTPEDKVVLFIGTPRLHKGIVEIAEALEKIGNPRYKLCIIGTSGKDLRARLKQLKGDHVRLFKNQPYSDLPANLGIGDLVCLLQDHKNDIARYQMPAKFTDALAMEIPILATDVPPLANLASLGLVELLGNAPLDRKIEEIFSNYAPFKARAVKNREVFLKEYSFAAAAEKLEGVMLPLLGETPQVPEEFERLLKFHREVFALPADSAVGGVADETQRRTPSRKLAIRGSGLGSQVAGTEENQRYVDDKYDIVFFWKQNDTGLYGRRQDMIVKYLSKSPKVARIVHFDAPIGAAALHSLWDSGQEGSNDQSKNDQSKLVYSQTLSRLLGLEHSEKVKHYTFVYAEGGRPVGKTPHPLGKGKRYLDYLRSVLKENEIGRRRTIFWVCPVNFDLPSIALAFNPELIVADVIDDNRTWFAPGSDEWEERSRNYEEVLGMSDLTITNSQVVKQTMLAFTDEIQVVPNAAELPDVREPRQARPEELKRLTGPILGYAGNLSSRIDIDLLEYLAAARPEWNIVLIGSTHLSKEVLSLDAHDNVHFLGVKRYPEVQQYIGNFDVALIPHLDNQMTRAMNPLKLFVYVSMNVPVVSTEIENLGELREFIHVARDKHDFLRKVESALGEGKDASGDEKLAHLLKQNSWEERVNTILELIGSRMPK
jgi:glycosyltransferase involved in cell wall biosynthesis